MKKFRQEVKEVIGSYVYALHDPDTNELFYIGKGKNDRCFDHYDEVVKRPEHTDLTKKHRIKVVVIKAEASKIIVGTSKHTKSCRDTGKLSDAQSAES